MTEIVWNEGQRAAIDKIVAWSKTFGGSMMAFTGSAGTGKTTTMMEIRKHLTGRVKWTALTGKAAFRLNLAAGVAAGTLHAALYKPPFNRGKTLYFSSVKEPDCDILVVDEASMTTPKIHEDLTGWVNKGVKVLYIGDSVQLPPILSFKEVKEYGDDFMVFNLVKGPNLTEVMRSGDGVLDVVSGIRERCRLPTVGNDMVKVGHVKYPGLAAIKDYLADPDDHFLITWTNKMRMQGNIEIRRRLKLTDPLPTATEPVLICKNGQEMLNGEVVTGATFEPGPNINELATQWMTLDKDRRILVNTTGKDQPFDGFMPDIKDWSLFHRTRESKKLPEPIPVTFGYVFTAHKAQGDERRRVSIYTSQDDLQNRHFNKTTTLPDGSRMPFSVRWMYTSASRARERLSIYYGL